MIPFIYDQFREYLAAVGQNSKCLLSYHVILIVIGTILWEKLKNNQPIDDVPSKQRDNERFQTHYELPSAQC